MAAPKVNKPIRSSAPSGFDYDFDPKGDAIIVLKGADRPLAASKDFVSPTKTSPSDIRIRASSKSLSLASSYFRKLFWGPWKETTGTQGNTEPCTVEAEGWSLKAFLILLDIFHARTSEVPRKLDLEVFASIAVLVDYYGCYKSIAFFAETWYQNLKEPIPQTVDRQLMLRLLLAWTFKKEADLRIICQRLLRYAQGPIDTLDLPIPAQLIGET